MPRPRSLSPGSAILKQGASYAKKVLALSPLRHWPLCDLVGASIVSETAVGSNVSGGYTSITLGQDGIGDGCTAARFASASNSRANIYSSSFSSAFASGGGQSTTIAWVKMDSARWTDGVRGRAYRIADSGNVNRLTSYKETFSNNWTFGYTGGGAAVTLSLELSTTEWFMVAMVVDRANTQMVGYVNGNLMGTVTPAAWTGTALDSTLCVLGAGSTVPADVLNGYLAHVSIFNRALTAAEILGLYQFHIPSKRMVLIGDSITSPTIGSWASHYMTSANGGRIYRINRAAAGTRIMTDMDSQVAASAGDMADMIFIFLGTNDADDAGITAEYQSGIEALKISNPKAKIYGLGILNKTDETNRSSNNTRIQTACANAGAVYVNTDGWINPATDTSDGLHPNLTGRIKVCNALMAVVP